MITRILMIVSTAALLGGANNLINPNKVDWVGNWPTNLGSCDTSAVIPAAEKGDPPFLKLTEAFDRFTTKKYLFVDAREPEEYTAGHIKGAINLPFETFDQHWSEVEPKLPKDTLIVTYCSGAECDASLMLARMLIKEHGYKNIEIFFGGWQCWDKSKLPIDGKYDEEVAH